MFSSEPSSPYFDVALTAKVLIELGKQEYNEVRPSDSLRYPGFGPVMWSRCLSVALPPHP
jgi:hypothetical protein